MVRTKDSKIIGGRASPGTKKTKSPKRTNIAKDVIATKQRRYRPGEKVCFYIWIYIVMSMKLMSVL